MVENTELQIEKDVSAFLEEWGKDERFNSLRDESGNDYMPKMLAFCEFFSTEKYSTADLEKAAEVFADKYAEKDEDIQGWKQENKNIESWNQNHPNNKRDLANLSKEEQKRRNIENIQNAFQDYIDNSKTTDAYSDIHDNSAYTADLQNAADAFHSTSAFYLKDGRKEMHNALAFKEGITKERKEALYKSLDNMGFKGLERPGPDGATVLVPADIKSAAILRNIDAICLDKELEVKDITKTDFKDFWKTWDEEFKNPKDTLSMKFERGLYQTGKIIEKAEAKAGAKGQEMKNSFMNTFHQKAADLNPAAAKILTAEINFLGEMKGFFKDLSGEFKNALNAAREDSLMFRGFKPRTYKDEGYKGGGYKGNYFKAIQTPLPLLYGEKDITIAIPFEKEVDKKGFDKSAPMGIGDTVSYLRFLGISGDISYNPVISSTDKQTVIGTELSFEKTPENLAIMRDWEYRQKNPQENPQAGYQATPNMDAYKKDMQTLHETFDINRNGDMRQKENLTDAQKEAAAEALKNLKQNYGASFIHHNDGIIPGNTKDPIFEALKNKEREKIAEKYNSMPDEQKNRYLQNIEKAYNIYNVEIGIESSWHFEPKPELSHADRLIAEASMKALGLTESDMAVDKNGKISSSALGVDMVVTDIMNKRNQTSTQNTSVWQDLKQKAKDIANPRGKTAEGGQKNAGNAGKQSVFSAIFNRRGRS